jgi:hypothetical protein
MAYAEIRDEGLVSSAVKWFFFRALVYVAVALISAAAFFAAVSIYAWTLGPIPKASSTPPAIDPPSITVPTPAPPSVPTVPPNVALVPELRLTADDVAYILAIIHPKPSPGGTRYDLGDRVTGGNLIPVLPTAIVEKVPQLRGFRYDVDADGAVVIINPRTYYVSAIIRTK